MNWLTMKSNQLNGGVSRMGRSKCLREDIYDHSLYISFPFGRMTRRRSRKVIQREGEGKRFRGGESGDSLSCSPVAEGKQRPGQSLLLLLLSPFLYQLPLSPVFGARKMRREYFERFNIPFPEVFAQGTTTTCLHYASNTVMAFTAPHRKWSVQQTFDQYRGRRSCEDFIEYLNDIGSVTTSVNYPLNLDANGIIKRQLYSGTKVKKPLLKAKWHRVEQGAFPTYHEAMVNMLEKTGSLMSSVAITEHFEKFDGGYIYKNRAPPSVDINHTLVIVAHGSEDGENFWLLQNSWGTDWGDFGYMKLLRGRNLHGIEQNAYYALVEEKKKKRTPKTVKWQGLGAYMRRKHNMRGNAHLVNPAQGFVLNNEGPYKVNDIETTLMVRSGTLKKSDIVVCDEVFGRVEGLFNDDDEIVPQVAGPYEIAKVVGLNNRPIPGDQFEVVGSKLVARSMAVTALEVNIAIERELTAAEYAITCENTRIAVANFHPAA